MSETIVLIEQADGRLRPTTLHAISLARQFEQPYVLLALGQGLDAVGASLASLGAAEVLLADDEALRHALADRYAKVIADLARSRGADVILGCSSTFTKDILPRVAGLLDVPMVSDVLEIERRDGQWLYRRPMYAGNIIATVRIDWPVRVLSVRATAFQPPAACSTASPIRRVRIDRAALPEGTEFVSCEQRATHRPDLCEARVVVAGGRPLKDRDTFERLIGGLADALGGAVASTRAAVDAGMAANDTQVGQTGKIVAPQLYWGIGISGAVQHMAGARDARVIVAINKDPEAPIFQVATYGLVGDLHQIVPQLIDALKRK